jgi:uncharacterized protein YbcC (UPF0753/DUF2309 family)
MSILEKLNRVKDTIPHYWPIGSFIHHNPLKGFEDLNFKEALPKAQSIFGGRVYMESSYYLRHYEEGTISHEAFEKSLKHILLEQGFEEEEACKIATLFLLESNRQWDSFRSHARLRGYHVDEEIVAHLASRAKLYNDQEAWVEALLEHMTLYEIHDLLFESNIKESTDKEIIEYISRFLDEEQTTISMQDRERGMFEAFKLYEDFFCEVDSATYVEEALAVLEVKDIESYLLTHILKLHGWAGFIKYRSEDSDYFSQQLYPSSMMDYLAIRLYYELDALKYKRIQNFTTLDAYIQSNRAEVILKLLKYRNRLSGVYIDQMEQKVESQEILDAYIQESIRLDALQIQLTKATLPKHTMPLERLITLLEILKKEEGFIWLKALEDSYILDYVEEFVKETAPSTTPLASATFCLDVRSETIRRKIEAVGNYSTYGAGGFLGIPIAFVEFDKAHEQFLAPAIVKPQNVVFEIPSESYEEYSSKKGINQTTKKVLKDLKNNPYTPYIMVEAIGWIFGTALFGKTFFPRKTDALFKRLKAQKPNTTYTLDKLSKQEIEHYVKELHLRIIKEVLAEYENQPFDEVAVESLWRHLLFGESFAKEISTKSLRRLEEYHKITHEDYLFQKEKLGMVGFTLDEKVEYLYKYLTMIGQVDAFAPFSIILGHGSVSDNNPFESALDCGACGGNISLPNTRALCMIANTPKVREKIKERGIVIPNETKFIAGMHVTTTDEITFYDLELLTTQEREAFGQIEKDFKLASFDARAERCEALPNASSDKDMFIKSMDWSEPRPEWGLAGNMGVFAGPRSSSKDIAFGNRLFLHSYDWRVDNANADILTRIFNGPLVVGEWINMEHYFSTVDNRVYGAGSKVYHNVVSKIGVYNGNYSDLKIGLPTQSVLLEGEAYHEPLRLLTFMEAPLEMVGKAVENSLAKPFILNEWIRPIIIDKEAKKVYSYEFGQFIVIKELH